MWMKTLALAVVAVTACAKPGDPGAGSPGETYRVAGDLVDLSSGSAEIPIPGVTGASARTRYRLLAEVAGDLNADGSQDRAAVVAVDTGGSGTFIHVAAILLDAGSPRSIESVLLGDRLEVADLRIMEPGHVDAGMIIVGLNIRDAGQPMSEEPRFYVTRMLRVQDHRLVEIPQY